MDTNVSKKLYAAYTRIDRALSELANGRTSYYEVGMYLEKGMSDLLAGIQQVESLEMYVEDLQ